MNDGEYSNEQEAWSVEHEKGADEKIGKSQKHLKTAQAIDTQKQFNEAGDVFNRFIAEFTLELALFRSPVEWWLQIQ